MKNEQLLDILARVFANETNIRLIRAVVDDLIIDVEKIKQYIEGEELYQRGEAGYIDKGAKE